MNNFIHIFKRLFLELIQTSSSVLVLALFFLQFYSPAFGQNDSSGQDTTACEIGVWPTCQAELLSANIAFAEGPLWHPDGFLLCSALNGDQILKIDPKSGSREVYLSPSGGSNGLAFDPQQNLIMCRRDARDVARLESDGSVTVLASTYNGKRFNSPNDLTVRSDGTIFFTDPHFGGSPPPQELNFDGIFCIKPDGQLKLLETSVTGPNGITLSPDEKKLYVNENMSGTEAIYVFDIENDVTLTNKTLFYQIPHGSYVDGMKVDENGMIFVAVGNIGIHVISPDGNWIDRILVPEGGVTNLNWGGSDRQTLYITAFLNVYKIRLNTKGQVTGLADTDPQRPEHFELMPNYPNPFNPATIINYTVPEAATVELKVFNRLGQEIRTLVNSIQTIGMHQVIWDGKNRNGYAVPTGLYFYRLQAGSTIATRKMILLR